MHVDEPSTQIAHVHTTPRTDGDEEYIEGVEDMVVEDDEDDDEINVEIKEPVKEPKKVSDQIT
jgi:hypothetical protein